MKDISKLITNGEAIIGIELGSTRIKAVLIDQEGNIIEKGGYDWENHLINGIWTYDHDEIIHGLQMSYQDLLNNVKEKYNVIIKNASSIGISGMMHGYLPFDKENNLLVPFRTWRNNMPKEVARELSDLFHYNIPQRWSVTLLYQSILNQEEHVNKINYMTTLSGYVHWRLTGQKVLGINDASGMFPIDIEEHDFNASMMDQFDEYISDKNYSWKIRDILPKVLVAGEDAGALSEEGAALLDISGNLQPGIKLCPPEGDGGTGMVATNSIKVNTGNISAGTSAFAMIVLEKELSKVYEDLDMVTTPSGKLVAMAHANNCTSDINAWMELFFECLQEFGLECNKGKLFETLFTKALQGDDDCGGLLSYPFYSGEHVVNLKEGYPIFLHSANANFNLANFIRTHIYSAFAAMKLGMDTLMYQEHVTIKKIFGHGGIFKTKGVAQEILASSLNVPIAVLETAGEGGAWGIAILAAYMNEKQKGISLEEYLENTIFKNISIDIVNPNQKISGGYQTYIKRYKEYLPVEYKAVSK